MTDIDQGVSAMFCGDISVLGRREAAAIAYNHGTCKKSLDATAHAVLVRFWMQNNFDVIVLIAWEDSACIRGKWDKLKAAQDHTIAERAIEWKSRIFRRAAEAVA